MMKKKLAMLLTAAAIGCTMTPALSTEAAWNVDGAGWWYTHPDGSYTTNSWEWVNGAWYHFDGTGYMQTGWQNLGGAWYYLAAMWMDPDGWQQIPGLEITMLAGMDAGSRDMERHSGSQTTRVGGIVTVTEDIPEMDGSRLTVSGICLTDRVIC